MMRSDPVGLEEFNETEILKVLDVLRQGGSIAELPPSVERDLQLMLCARDPRSQLKRTLDEASIVTPTGDGGEVPTTDATRGGLRFHPSEVRCPSFLSSEHVEKFNCDGYVSGIQVFSKEEMLSLVTYVNSLLTARMDLANLDSERTFAHMHYGRIYDLLRDTRIVSLVSDLLGENVVGWGATFFCKMPNDGTEVPWHRDAVYWPLSPSKGLTVWIAVDDADQGNACMQYFPGSHLSLRDADGVISTSTCESPAAGLKKIVVPTVAVELTAGEVSVHSDLLLHGSGANSSSRRRCGLTLRYCAADVQAPTAWYGRSVVVRGTDASSRWQDLPRPLCD